MKKNINIILATFSFVLLLFSLSFCEDKVILTTYYPSPYGSYKDLDIHNKLVFKDPLEGNAEVTMQADTFGGLHLASLGNPGFQIIFDDYSLPYVYYLSYTSGPPTYCENGYAAVNYLTTSRVVAYSSAPSAGYIVCMRGTP